ncbi:killer toxin subunits alpha beta [Fusarium heterosporum]|uniref:Killer toxin subunits alpha beta n=1 Tax=Fusarium heterosporum TaxID=42747 RepID=A0A8H5WHI4_FUSHE|nr:killer toxin subunits alpha beta [Fusarium heterosporum]
MKISLLPVSALAWTSTVGAAALPNPLAEYGVDPEVARRQSKVPLRVLPLGASTVFGVVSQPEDGRRDGFRKPFRDALRTAGWEVNMVGTQNGGMMRDSDNEGHPGYKVAGISKELENSLPFKPNLVMINAGTNDGREHDVDDPHVKGVGESMREMIMKIYNEPGMDRTCVLLSTLLWSRQNDESRKSINNQYRDLVDDLKEQGKCIFLADQDPDEQSTWIPQDMITDGIHPTTEGHKKMAAVFYKAFELAASSNSLVPPVNVPEIGATGCPREPGKSKKLGTNTQKGGAGQNNGIYKHKSEEMPVKTTITSSNDLNQYRFAKLFGRESDELVGWYEQSDGNHSFGVWKSNGDGSFTKIDDLNPDLFCKPAGINFIDMNGDGFDDLVCIGPDGNAQLSVNQGDGDKDGDKPPTFKHHGEIKENEGFGQAHVRLADIDGDGRGDYCVIDDKGDIQCWRNGGTGEVPEYWQSLGTRFTSKNMGDMNGVRFADINGDGRDDWLWVSNVGQTTTYTNGRSCAKGKEGDGLNVYWRQGFSDGKTSGPTHPGMGQYGRDGLRNRVFFARIYDKPETRARGMMNALDYVFLHHEEEDGEHRFTIRTWKNVGGGGNELNADGNRYCNMWGHGDGKSDFIWVAPDGTMRGWKNLSKKSLGGSDSFWQAEERDIWVPRDYGKTIHDRRNIHLADWDGDGTCDIVLVDPSQEFKVVDVWLNERPYKEGWNWNHQANPESAADVRCKNEKNGLGINDLAVRFADLTSNGRADYLCISPDGTTNAWIHNEDNSWTNAEQVKASEGVDRADIRWNDVNGDGKADMILVDKFTGDARVSYNEGDGTSFTWSEASAAFDGSVAGTCQNFPDLDGNSRADLHSVLGTDENKADTWLSDSCGLNDRSGDSVGLNGVVDPELPTPPEDCCR